MLALAAIKQFIAVCRKLESVCCHNVERLVRIDIDKEKELYPTGTLYRIVREISDKNDRTYFLGLLVNREKTAVSAGKPFMYKNIASFACAQAKEEALVSLETNADFKQTEIAGFWQGKGWKPNGSAG